MICYSDKKMKRKAIFRVVILAGIVLFVAFKFLYGSYRSNKFYNAKLNHLVTQRDNSALRSTVFELANGVEIDSSLVDGFDLRVGDSVVKDAGSRRFSVYRKTQGQPFTLIHIYNTGAH